jgi:hypothetical protein
MQNEQRWINFIHYGSKGHEGANVNACNEFGNDPMKMHIAKMGLSWLGHFVTMS